ncbi:MAG: hypothetical protein ACLTBF_08410, partial [Christensenellales bacterium]
MSTSSSSCSPSCSWISLI